MSDGFLRNGIFGDFSERKCKMRIGDGNNLDAAYTAQAAQQISANPVVTQAEPIHPWAPSRIDEAERLAQAEDRNAVAAEQAHRDLFKGWFGWIYWLFGSEFSDEALRARLRAEQYRKKRDRLRVKARLQACRPSGRPFREVLDEARQ